MSHDAVLGYAPVLQAPDTGAVQPAPITLSDIMKLIQPTAVTTHNTDELPT